MVCYLVSVVGRVGGWWNEDVFIEEVHDSVYTIISTYVVTSSIRDRPRPYTTGRDVVLYWYSKRTRTTSVWNHQYNTSIQHSHGTSHGTR